MIRQEVGLCLFPVPALFVLGDWSAGIVPPDNGAALGVVALFRLLPRVRRANAAAGSKAHKLWREMCGWVTGEMIHVQSSVGTGVDTDLDKPSCGPEDPNCSTFWYSLTF